MDRFKGKVLFCLFLLSVILLAACATKSTSYKYWQGYQLIEPAQSSIRSYKDDFIEIYFNVDPKRIFYNMRNLTKGKIVLDLADSKFIKINGDEDLLTDGSYCFKENFKGDQTVEIEADKSYSSFFVPKASVKKVTDWVWSLEPLFDLKTEKSLENVGKTFGIDISVKADAKEKRYRFTFMITDVVPIVDRLRY